jgi:uncharacterized membrane protein
MSSNTTLASTNKRIDAIEETLSRIESLLANRAPKKRAAKKATPAKKAVAKKTGPRKTAERKPASTTIQGKTCLVSANRQKFIADHDWAQAGMSVRQLAEAVLLGGQPLVGNWAIGPKRTVLVTGEAPKVAKAKTQAVAAKVSASDSAKPCRRANGTIAPKVEWDVRRTLEAQGLSPAKVDKRTAKAMALLS